MGPFTLILFAVWPVVLASAAYLILFEFTLVVTSVGERQFAFAFLLAVDVVSFVLGAIWP